MRAHYEKNNRDDHLPPIGDHDRESRLPSLKEKILRLSEGKDPIAVLKDLNKRTGIGGPPPYLAIRPANPAEGRAATIVIRYSRIDDEESFGLTAGDLSDPDDSEEAQSELRAYCERRLFELHAKHDTASIRFRTVFEKFLEAINPDSPTVDLAELELLDDRRSSNQDARTIFTKATFHAGEIIGFVKNRRLGTLDADFAKDYQRHAQKKTPGIADGTIAPRLTFVRKAFDWFRRKFRPPYRIEFESIEIKTNATAELIWEEARLIILHCLGYVWDSYGFATEWFCENGEWLLRFKRHDADHVALFAAVIRYILIYWFTGTRASRIVKMGWRPLNKRGWIDVARQWISRNGRKDPNYVRKPQESGALVPCVAALLGRMQARDEKTALEKSWSVGLQTSYVVHNGAGGWNKDVRDLAKEAFEAVGIDARRHDLKGGGATGFWHAGFSITQISWYFGNKEQSIDKAYRSRKNSEEANLRPRIDPVTATLDQIVDPLGKLPKIPRRDPPPPPGASIVDADRLIRGELENAIAQVLHG